MGYRSGCVTVTIDAEEALDEICDEQLLEEVVRRKLHKKAVNGFDMFDEVKKAWDELRGRAAEALSIGSSIRNGYLNSVARHSMNSRERSSDDQS